MNSGACIRVCKPASTGLQLLVLRYSDTASYSRSERYTSIRDSARSKAPSPSTLNASCKL